MAGRSRVSEPKQQDKPFQISKWVVWEAFQRVKANKGAAGSPGRDEDGGPGDPLLAPGAAQ
jgi:hypothetical protein